MVVERSGEDSLFSSFGVAGEADSQSEAAIVDVIEQNYIENRQGKCTFFNLIGFMKCESELWSLSSP